MNRRNVQITLTLPQARATVDVLRDEALRIECNGNWQRGDVLRRAAIAIKAAIEATTPKTEETQP